MSAAPQVDVERHRYDVLVIGAGGDGLRAAIASAETGVRTGLVCKSLLGKAHTVMAEGGVAAAFGNVAPEDNWTVHFQDTMFSAKYLNNWHMAELHAKEAPDRVTELEHWGAVFDRTADRRMDQRAFGGHTHRRLVHIGDRTGLEVIRTLQDKTVHSGVEVFMECTMTRLLKHGDRVCGAFGHRRATGTFIVFEAKSIVLATGGAGRCWKITSNSGENAGDGHALAYEAGAELIDMEFVQFHPTGMAWPPGVIGLLVTEAVRGEGGILRNAEGERFMERYDPKRLELSTRDVVARAIYTEVREGRGTPHGGVFLDVSHLPSDTLRTRLPSMYDQFMELAGVDITREPMEVGPTCHYLMGGVSVGGDTGASRVPGLFATGECTVRWNCKAAKCGSCSAEINGMPRLMCKTRLDHLPTDQPITVEPLRAFPLVRDLVTDVSWNYEVNKRIPPFTPAPDTDWSLGQDDVDRVAEFRKCIECFLCQDTCHVLRDHRMHDKYYGPRFLVRVASLEMHPLDTLDIPLKERLVDRRYDPLAKLGRRRRRKRRRDPGRD